MSRFTKKDNLIGQASSFLEVLDHVSLAAPIEKPVLIIGERGTGKELIAERIHFLSKRWEQSYLKLNCATLAESVLESELFGHESGSFTGASKRHEGRFERANGGTLFLDELANTSLQVQEKLLNVIEYGQFERVGGSRPVKTDVRLICATNEDLPTLVEQGTFRADLLDRLAFDVITLPPLRHRQEDILVLAESFAINMARQLELEYFGGFGSKAKQILTSYDWPGNVRELKNVVERSLYRHDNAALPLQKILLDPFESPYRPTQSIASSVRAQPPASAQVPLSTENVASQTQSTATNAESPVKHSFPLDFKQTSESYEIEMIKQALTSAQFSQKKAAEQLGVTYHQLRGLLKKYNLLDSSNI
ncbi:phage shock protein operon transcriptional activator [Psychrobium sp. 1_MG-2023]|uniref:phage shock protein operon transcriptional activator n=1 Tax=Psychrobium sp. 1_MG-2023 TaxID=3062624 RepID=UPI000C34E553|nr:phage shock protein operon transcriptional activator [Psychrobium sp. 1_MG-2023]MDP2562427.1 phage shock protein operon transcriptional activator [Psychrobium sp. 1_MG-2023]PKF56155.1 phage shock protein operon transcriptional activator [Alteromonadales bacterium alter-6D02]